MTIHRLKLKDLDEKYIQKLKSEQKNNEKEIVIWISNNDNMMEDKAFWEIISLLDWTKNTHNQVIEPAVHFLSRLSIDRIEAFHNSLSEKLYLLDGLKYAQNMGDNAYKGDDSPFSVDAFLYARCAVLSEGEKVFESVFSNPEEMLKNQRFEHLLDIADFAYRKKTGKIFDHIPSYLYETFSNSDAWGGQKGLLEKILG